MTDDQFEFLRRWGEHAGSGAIMAGALVHATGRRLPLWIYPSGQPIMGGHVRLPRPGGREWGVEICPIPCVSPPRGARITQWRNSQMQINWPFAVLDIDQEPGGPTPGEIVEAVRMSAPEPWMDVASGGGRHLWWALDRPAPAAEARHAMATLAEAYRGDPQVAKRPSLRMPGTWNAKRGRYAEIVDASWATCSIDDLLAAAPTIHRRVGRRSAGRIVREGIPAWIVQTLDALTPEGLSTLSVKEHQYQGVVRPIAVVDVCPACKRGGSRAHLYLDEVDPRLICKGRWCRGVASLADEAARHGIEVEEDLDDLAEYRYRDVEYEDQFIAPHGRVYSLERRAAEQEDIRRAVHEADIHSQQIPDDDDQTIFVVEAGTGQGKSYTIAQAIEEIIRRSDIYSPSQAHARELIRDWQDGSRKHVLHISPLYLTDREGRGCLRPDDLRVATAGGWEASRHCRTKCDVADQCTVRQGYVELGGQTDPGIHHYTHRRLATTHTAQRREPRIAWIDEHFPLIDKVSCTRSDLQALMRCGYVAREWKAIASAILDAWDWPLGMPPQAQWTPPWRRDVWAPLELPANRRVERPEKVRYPRHIFRLLSLVHEVTRSGYDARQSGALVWRQGDKIWAFERTIDRRLPRTVIWSSATYFLFHDLVSSVAKVRRYGEHMTSDNVERIHYPYKHAVRGGRPGVNRILRLELNGRKVCDESWARPLRAAIREATARWRAAGGEGDPRVLVASYKAVAEHGFGEGADDFCERVGCDYVDYYERLVGSNDYQDRLDVLVCLGDPNPGAGGEEAAWAVLYGQLSAGIMYRLSQQCLMQTEGRMRAVRAPERHYVVAAITPRRPVYWGDDAEEISLGHGDETCLDIWSLAQRQYGFMSKRFARKIISAVHGLDAYRRRGCTGETIETPPLDRIRQELDRRDAWGVWRADGLPVDWLERISIDAGYRRLTPAKDGHDAVWGDPEMPAFDRRYRERRVLRTAVALSERDLGVFDRPTPWTAKAIERAGGKRRLEAIREAVSGTDGRERQREGL